MQLSPSERALSVVALRTGANLTLPLTLTLSLTLALVALQDELA